MTALDAGSLAREFRSRVDALPEPRVPLVRPIRREISKRIASAEPEQVLELARLLIALDLRGWAYEVVHFHRPTVRTLGPRTAGGDAPHSSRPPDNAVESFLSDNDNRLAARVRREVRNKLSTGLKNPRKTPG